MIPLAEVMDKMPGIGEYWGRASFLGVVAGLVVFALTTLRVKPLPAAIVASIVFGGYQLTQTPAEITDPVNVQVWREDMRYGVASVLSTLVPLTVPFFVHLGRRKRTGP